MNTRQKAMILYMETSLANSATLIATLENISPDSRREELMIKGVLVTMHQLRAKLLKDYESFVAEVVKDN